MSHTVQPQYFRESSSDEHSYSPKATESNLLEKHEIMGFESRRRRILPRLVTAFNVIIFLVSTVMFVKGLQWQFDMDRRCLKLHSTYSPALEDVDPNYRPVLFNGTLDHPSIYRGDPSPEIDAAWDDLEDVRVMSISEEEVLKIGKTTDAIKIPEQFGGGYMTSVEMNHQLHCINFLRKSLSPDYYSPPSPYASVEFTDAPSMVKTHQRHCIEMMRQFVMCHADMGMITHRWVKDYPRPYPDFSTWHQCRNFEDALQWTKDKQLDERDGGPPSGWKYKPGEGDVILPMPP